MSVDLDLMNDVDDRLVTDSVDDEAGFSSNYFSLLNLCEIVVDKHLDVARGNVPNHCSWYQVISCSWMTPVLM